MSANLENSPAATGQRKVNSHSNPKEGQMPKNVQTTIQLHSFHMGAKLCSKSIKRGFSSMQTENFQINKLGLGKAEEPEMKLPTSLDHRESQGIWENIYCSFIDCTKAFDSVDHNKLWKILREMGIPDHRTYLLRHLYAGQEATVRTEHATVDWFKNAKGECQGYVLSPCFFTYMQSISCKIPGWINHKLDPRLLGEISTTSDMQMVSL